MHENNHVELWDRCLSFIKDNIPERAYSTWFTSIKPLKYDGNTLTIEVPTQFFFEFIEEHYADLLSKALLKSANKETRLTYSIQPVNGNTTKSKSSEEGRINLPSNSQPNSSLYSPKSMDPHQPSLLKAPATQDLDSNLKRDYTFENFIEGSSNRLPRAAAEAVAKKPGKTPFNPLFIYGQSGIGKTHLVNAIGNEVKDLHPEMRVLYVSAHLFQVQYTNSVRNNTVNDFINFYQSIDVLIIDDVQEFASLTKTQNTFFHIFNQLHQSGKQLVLTSDRSPVMLQGMEDRLLTRFKWGLLAELEKPNTELRKNILKNKMYRDGLKFPESVVNFIAENVSESVRDLEGIVNSLMAHSIVYNKDIDLELAKRVIKKVVKIESKQVTIERIIAKVCLLFDMDTHAVQKSSRQREVVQVRQIAMYLAKKHTAASSAQIGQAIGKRDHATVLHAYKLIKQQLEVDKELRSKVEEIEAELHS